MFAIVMSIEISPNRIRITNGKTGNTTDRTALRPFSTSRHLIADRTATSDFMREVLIETMQRRRSFFTWPTANVTLEGETSPLERDTVREILTDQGFRKITGC